MIVKFESLSDAELVLAFGELHKELRKRSLIRSKNVVGDLGEHLCIRHYCGTAGLPNLQAAPAGTMNIDAISRNGDRYSIKASTGNVTGVFYGLPANDSDEMPNQKFEFVLVAKFDKNFLIQMIYELTWEQFLIMKRWHSRMQAWNLPITKELSANSRIVYDRDRDGTIF